MTIHDALIVEAPEKNYDEVSSMMVEVMERKGREFTDYVPFYVDVSSGKSWGELG